jgi:two-component system C4-dicarboxylate transport response regulator DctD
MDKLKALVVDDEESVCEAVKAVLETEGFAVTITTSSPEAVELVRTRRYDLIISDLKMPVLDGMQFYDKVREIENRSIFLVMTAYSDLYPAVDAVSRGIYDYLQKPFTPDELRLPVRQRLKLVKEKDGSEKTGGA